MLIAGLGFPIIPWLLHKRWPKVGFNYVFTPVLVGKQAGGPSADLILTD